MSTQRCLYQLLRNRSNRELYRPISTTSYVCHENQDKSNESEKDKNKTVPNKGIFGKIREEFIKDAEKNESTKETLEKLRKTSSELRTQYDQYIGSKLPKFNSKSEEDVIDNKAKLRDQFNTLKSKFNKDKLREDSIKFGNTFREKSEGTISSIKTWREKKTPEKSDHEQAASDVESGESSSEVSKTSKLSEMLQSSGVLDNKYVKMMKDKTSTYINVDSQKISEVYKTSGISDALQKSKELSEQMAEKSKAVSDELGKKVGEVSGELGKKVGKVSEDLGKRKEEAAEEIARGKEQIARSKDQIAQSETFKKASEVTTETLKMAAEEMIDSTKLKESEMYKSPEQLKMRIEETEEGEETSKFTKKVHIDETTMGVTAHKGSKWENEWKNFKENNPLADRILEYRIKMEESDNLFMRAGYKVIDVMSGVFSGMVEPHDISLTIAEIHKVDPGFVLTDFATVLRFDIVPNVIEAYLRKDVGILENWCHERAFGQFKQMIASRVHTGAIQLIDIGECDIITGKMLEQGPVFMFNVQTQQMFSETKHSKTENGEVLETTEDKIKMVIYTVAVCRDQTMMDPTAAWTVLEIIEHVIADSYV